MSDKLNAALEVLEEQLAEQMSAVAETKKLINSLNKRMGRPIPYPDDSPEMVASMGTRADQYYGKPLATAITEYLEQRRARNLGAATAEEVLKALEQGGFDFKALGWQDAGRLRSLAISLVKNSKTFHKLPNGSFGLASWYDQAILRKAERAKATTDEEGGEEGDPAEGGQAAEAKSSA